MNLLVANQLAADLCTEELEAHMAFVAAALRARQVFRDLDEVEPRRSPLPPADTDPAPRCGWDCNMPCCVWPDLEGNE